MRNDKISQRQLMVLALVGILSPTIRILPGSIARLGEKAAWLSPLVAVVPVVLYGLMMNRVMKNRGEGEGFSEIFCRCIGRVPGKVVASLFGLWIIFYAGFDLRMSAERLLSTVYSFGKIGIFTVTMAAAALIVAMGRTVSLARTAEVYSLILFGVLTVVLLFSAGDVRTENLLPIIRADAGGILLGTLPVLNIVLGMNYFGFLAGHVDISSRRRGGLVKWPLILIGVIFVITVVTFGALSVEIINVLPHSFFMMIRNVKIFGFIERIEALVITLWVVTDFVYISSLIMMCGEIGVSVSGGGSRKVFSAVAVAAALAVSFKISDNAFTLLKLSEVIVPLINMGLFIIVVPVIFGIGFIRKKI